MTSATSSANKIRVYDLSKTLGISNKEVMDALEKHFGVTVKSHSSCIEEDVAAKLEKLLKSPNKPAKSEDKPDAPVVAKAKAEAAAKPAEPPKPTVDAATAERPFLVRPKKVIDPEAESPENKAPEKPQIELRPAGRPSSSLIGNVTRPDQKPAVTPPAAATTTPTTTPQAPANTQTRPSQPAGRPSSYNQPGTGYGQRPSGTHGQPTRPDMGRPTVVHGQPVNPAAVIAPPTEQKPGAATGHAKPKPVYGKSEKDNPAEKKLEMKFQPKKNRQQEELEPLPEDTIFQILEPLTVGELAAKIRKKEPEVIKHLFMKGIMVTINQTLQVEDALQLLEELGFLAEGPQKTKIEAGTPELKIKDVKGDDLQQRAPVVSIMGHVDHGKTSLLDAIRAARHKIVDSEAGGITQKIGAYTVEQHGKKIVFIDTPGHAAFTAMRLRGARATDIAIIVVAADDGVMPQTIEAINHARQANVPIIIAVNKIDKPGADPDKVLMGLSEVGITPEKWGGDTLTVEISALQKLGLDDLLEMILLVSELQELKADASLEAEGVVIESWLDKGKGAVATVLVQSGTLKVGDNILIGNSSGRVRALIGDDGQRLKEAGPSTPAEILGLDTVPEAGQPFKAFHDDKEFKKVIADARNQEKENRFARSVIPGLYDGNEADRKDFYVIVKADTQGSVEAITSSILQLATEEVPVHVIHAATGDVSEADVLLASANKSLIVCFNTGVEGNAAKAAESHGIKIRDYDIIYKLSEDIEKMMLGLLSPDEQENQVGSVEVRQLFTISNNVIAGCYVQEGKVFRNAKAQVFRGNKMIHEGTISQLKRFKEDAKEVQTGFECGISFAKFNDLTEGDIIKVFETKLVERTSL